MRILITGVSGFVGLHLARYLVRCGHEVEGTYIQHAPDLPGVGLHDVDLLDPKALAGAVGEAAPDAIVHLAGLSHVGLSWRQPAQYFRVNVLGAENLLRVAADIRVITASSAEVYGKVEADLQPISEDQPLAPQSPYALTKAAMERLALAQGAIVARAFNIVGPGQMPTFALPAFAAQLARIEADLQEPVLQVGNLTARRDFVHVEDAAAGYGSLLLDGAAGEAYNLGSGRDFSIEEALHELIEVSQVEAEIETDPDKLRPVDLPHLQADVSKLGQLGWAPKKTLKDAVCDLWQARLVPDVAGVDSSSAK